MLVLEEFLCGNNREQAFRSEYQEYDRLLLNFLVLLAPYEDENKLGVDPFIDRDWVTSVLIACLPKSLLSSKFKDIPTMCSATRD